MRLDTRLPSAFLAAATLIAVATPVVARDKKKDQPPMLAVGRTPMAAPVETPPPPPPAPVTTIADALPAIPNHTTLVRLVQAAQLSPVLGGPGPITVFAPADDAFARLAPGTVDTLLKPANIASLTAILKYHVVAGTVTMDQLKGQIAAGGGRAMLTTLNGQPLIATLENGLILLTDANGGKSYVSQGDLKEANGVVHITNGVSVPKLG